MSRPGPSSERDAFFVLVACALALCLGAAADVGYGDAGELGTAAVVLGVAHPTGFALDLLWLKAASFVPLGSLAFRLNLATALAGAAALGLCAALIGTLAERASVRDRSARRWGVLIGTTGLLGFAPFVSATRAVEVYPLALAAVLLALYVAITGGRWLGLLVLVVGLAFGMHVTAGLYAAPVLLVCLVKRPARGRFLIAHAPVLLAGMLVLAYLPLASLRDPPIDWGDPETLSGVLMHLTAQRIRTAYQAEMFGGSETTAQLLAEQLLTLGPLLAFALLAVVVAFVQSRRAERAPELVNAVSAASGIAAILGLDLGYALLVNPMGVRDLQCGHVAGACTAILGGAGAAWLLVQLAERRAVSVTLRALIAACALVQLAPRSIANTEDGFALNELFGSGGPLTALPPRSVFLCSGDNACAASMFALMVERARPDMASAPAQHLWDATVLRQIAHFETPAARSEAERPARARANALALLEGRSQRPVALETRSVARDVAGSVALAPLGASPFLTPASELSTDAFAPSLVGLKRMLHARFGSSATPDDEHARLAWSRTYGELGSAAIFSPAFRDGIAALQAAATIAPTRATAWINLGVGLEAAGQLEAAIEVTQRAVQLEPLRATGWANLARFEQRRGNTAAARNVLILAAHAGVDDPRLTALASQLLPAGVPPP